jgi:hypothetical protein
VIKEMQLWTQVHRSHEPEGGAYKGRSIYKKKAEKIKYNNKKIGKLKRRMNCGMKEGER